MSDGLSIATQTWRLRMMCTISSEERIAFGAQVEGTRGELFAASHISFHSRFTRVPSEPMVTVGHNPRVIVGNGRLTECEEMVKQRSEGDIK